MEEMKTNVTQSESTRVSVLTERIEALITEARTKIVSFVNTAMVYTYYEIGRMIVEDEQGGEYRAESRVRKKCHENTVKTTDSKVWERVFHTKH